MLAISPSVRHEAAVNLLLFPREYGRQTSLSDHLGVSTRWLRGFEGRLVEGLQPRPPGRPRARTVVLPTPPPKCCYGETCRHPERERAVQAVTLRLAVSPCSLRDSSDVLRVGFGASRSPESLAKQIREAGRKAAEGLESLGLRQKVIQAAADEIFAGRDPILTVVEPESMALLDAVRAGGRTGEDWDTVFRRYPQLRRVAADCGTGLRAGMKARGIEHQPDIFHGLVELGRAVRRLEAIAYEAMDRWFRAQRQWERARDRGEDLRSATQHLRHAQRKAEGAMRHHDLALWLAREIRAALRVPERVTPEYRREAMETIRTAVALLGELGVPHYRKIQTYFEPERILSFLDWALAHPDHPILRASSCVEAVNSFLRVDQTVKKHLGQAYLDLLRWFYNMRPFSTGKRKGRAPLEILGVEVPYRSWLEPLIT